MEGRLAGALFPGLHVKKLALTLRVSDSASGGEQCANAHVEVKTGKTSWLIDHIGVFITGLLGPEGDQHREGLISNSADSAVVAILDFPPYPMLSPLKPKMSRVVLTHLDLSQS